MTSARVAVIFLSMNAATETRTAQTATITAGDLVFVRPAYSLTTRANTTDDLWSETHMIVIKVCSNGDCLLDYDEDGEGEVYINESRLVCIR